MRFDDLVEKFLEKLRYSGASGQTIRAYQFHLSKLDRFLEDRNLAIENLDSEKVKEFRNYLVQKGLSVKSINAILSACKSFFDF